MHVVHQHDPRPEPSPQHDCGLPIPLISTQLVVLFVAQAALVITLITLCAVPVLAAVGVAVLLVAGDIYVATVGPRGLKTLIARSGGWGQ